jgi:uncharacterized Zn finger protein
VSPRENALVKGQRYVAAGRLTVRHVSEHSIDAHCRGDRGEIYQCGYERGGWYCSCPARGDCSHLYALWSVCVRPGSSAS